MDAKISVTTKCNASCRTCPVWKLGGKHAEYTDFVLMWRTLMYAAPQVHRVLVNNTGDLFCHPEQDRIIDYMEAHKPKRVIMTTNGIALHRVPEFDEIIISFNGFDRDTYEYTTGADFDRVVGNIRAAYPQLARKCSEIHCLMWDATYREEAEARLLELWGDFPGRVRVSYKFDNQQDTDHTVAAHKQEQRIPCDYLDVLSVWPDGSVIMCAHDFRGENVWGNVIDDPVDDILRAPGRLQKLAEHRQGSYTGICSRCNYNVPIKPGAIRYIKG